MANQMIEKIETDGAKAVWRMYQATNGVISGLPVLSADEDRITRTLTTKYCNGATGTAITDGLDVGITADGTAEIRQRENLPIQEYTNNSLRRIATGGGHHIFNGATTPRSYALGTVIPRVQIEGMDLASGSIAITRNSADAAASCFYLGKTRSSVFNGTTLVLDGDFIGVIYFTGSDGTNMVNAGSISARVNGSPSSGTIPIDIALNVGANAALTAKSDLNLLIAKNIGNAFHKETGFAVTSTFAVAPNLPFVSGFTKFRVMSGNHSAFFTISANGYSGNNVWFLATGASVQTVTANSVFSFRLGDSVVEIRFDTGSGVTSFRVASGTVKTIDVYRVTESIAIW